MATVSKAQRELSEALDRAVDSAMRDPKAGVQRVVALLNAAAGDATQVQNIMDAATARGFHCEFWPTGIRVEIRQPLEGWPAHAIQEWRLDCVKRLVRDCRIASFDDKQRGGRLDRFDFYSTAGGLLVIHEKRVNGTKYELEHFDVLRPMGNDNKMETLLREVREYAGD